MSIETTVIDGRKMATLPLEELHALIDELDDLRNAARFDALKAEADAEGYMPGEVLDLIMDDGLPRLAAWRRDRGLSQTELAEKAGIRQLTVARIEGGKSEGQTATLKRLAAALDAPMWTLRND